MHDSLLIRSMVSHGKGSGFWHWMHCSLGVFLIAFLELPCAWLHKDLSNASALHMGNFDPGIVSGVGPKWASLIFNGS